MRNSLEAANRDLQASAADLENIRLVVSSELAADYFALRELDSEIEVVRKAIDDQQKALELIERRHAGGAASGLDVVQQQVVLDSSRTQLSLLDEQRAQYQHALAELQGLAAAQFTALPAALTPLRPRFL